MSRGVLGIVFAFVASATALVGLLASGGGRVAVTAPGPVAGAAGVPPSFADIVERVNSAVVNVTVLEGTGRSGGEDLEDLPDFQGPRRGEGSGFVVDAEGYILTNHHLVPGPARIRVRFADKRELPARLVGADASTDLALLKVDARNLAAVRLGDSDRLRVGEWVCAIGNPYRFDHSVTVGVVSSKGRKIWDASFDAYIQTDAAINPGNSGGPLINAVGEAVGISSAVSRVGQGIGFAVPINVAREILDQLRTRGHVSRGYLGVQLQELDPDLQKLVGLREPRGAMVLDVQKGSAGEAAGLKRYDVITEVSGRRIEDGDELVRTISARAPGSSVTLTVVRDGGELSLEARLGERSASSSTAASTIPAERSPAGDSLGLEVADLSPRMRAELEVPADRVGVVVRQVLGLVPGAEELSHGDIIVEVNRRPTPDAGAYRKVVSSLPTGEVAWLYVYRPRPRSAFLAKVEVGSR